MMDLKAPYKKLLSLSLKQQTTGPNTASNSATNWYQRFRNKICFLPQNNVMTVQPEPFSYGEW